LVKTPVRRSPEAKFDIRNGVPLLTIYVNDGTECEIAELMRRVAEMVVPGLGNMLLDVID
jgi:hypothetical protein